MQDFIVIAQGFSKILLNFAPITLLMSAAVWVTTQFID